jgi:molybdate/tungstate transport system permease protein
MPNIRRDYDPDTTAVSRTPPTAGKESVRRTSAFAGRAARVAGSIVGPIAGLLASALLLFLVAPVAGIAAAGGGAGARLLVGDAELRAALTLTAATATTATALAALGGVPIAWLLARRAFRGRWAVEVLLDLPLVLPHPVAGIALLLVLGRSSAFGASLADAGLRVIGTPAGTVCAMLFVAAPLFVSAARESFARIDPSLELVARTLGEDAWGAFRRVTLPLARRGARRRRGRHVDARRERVRRGRRAGVQPEGRQRAQLRATHRLRARRGAAGRGRAAARVGRAARRPTGAAWRPALGVAAGARERGACIV